MTAIRNKRKIVLMLFIFAALAMTLLFTLGKTNQSFTSMDNIKLSYSDIAQAIKIKYDQELGKLEDYKASHYAARIYRISGITTYLAYNSQDLRNMKDDVEQLLQVARLNSEANYSKKKSGQLVRRNQIRIAPQITGHNPFPPLLSE